MSHNEYNTGNMSAIGPQNQKTHCSSQLLSPGCSGTIRLKNCTLVNVKNCLYIHSELTRSEAKHSYPIDLDYQLYSGTVLHLLTYFLNVLLEPCSCDLITTQRCYLRFEYVIHTQHYTRVVRNSTYISQLLAKRKLMRKQQTDWFSITFPSFIQVP